jgi:hypothetical protein
MTLALSMDDLKTKFIPYIDCCRMPMRRQFKKLFSIRELPETMEEWRNGQCKMDRCKTERHTCNGQEAKNGSKEVSFNGL